MADSSQEVNRLRAELAHLKREVAELQHQTGNLDLGKRTQQSTLNSHNNNFRSVKADIGELGRMIADLRTEIDLDFINELKDIFA